MSMNHVVDRFLEHKTCDDKNELLDTCLFREALMTHSLTQNGYTNTQGFTGPIHHRTIEKYIVDPEIPKQFFLDKDAFYTVGAAKSYTTFYVGKDYVGSLLVTKSAGEGRYYCVAKYASGNMERVDDLIEALEAAAVAVDETGSVYVLQASNSGLSAAFAGKDYIPLNRHHYTEEVLTAYDTVVSEFSIPSTDRGFMAIFSGPPGTGKTFLIRGLIGDIKDAVFLIIPPELMQSLQSPQLIGTFLQLAGNNKDKRIILLIEDADIILAPRAETSMSGTSNLLNITDGVLGKLLNLRVIATTNTPVKSLEAAILRPGRLLLHQEVGKLSFEQAAALYERLDGKGRFADTGAGTSLADVFAAAKGLETAKKARKVGF